MLDSGGVLNRATVDVVAERSELRTGVTALHESAQSLQDLITAGTDPSKLGSDLSIVLANFDNAPVLFVNTSAFDTDPSTRRAAAPFGATSLLAPLGGDGASVLLASKSTTVRASSVHYLVVHKSNLPSPGVFFSSLSCKPRGLSSVPPRRSLKGLHPRSPLLGLRRAPRCRLHPGPSSSMTPLVHSSTSVFAGLSVRSFCS